MHSNNDSIILGQNNIVSTQPTIQKSNKYIAVEILNYFYVILIQIFPALIAAYIFSKIFCDRHEEEYETMSTTRLFIELCIEFWSILVLYYIFRNIIVHVPSPFDNLFNSGFKNNMVNETKSGYVFTIVFIICHESLRPKIRVFSERLFKK
jgi:hypothetical protein